MVPLLVLWAGFDQRRASATSLLAIVPASLAGALTYGVAGNADITVAVLISVGAIVGAPVGSALLRRLPVAALRWMFIAMLLVEGLRLILVTDSTTGTLTIDVWAVIGLLGLGLLMGVASGLLGIGGGVIAVPVMMSLFGMPALLAKGTSLIAMIPTAISGSVGNLHAGVATLRDGAIMGLAAVLASLGGAAISFALSPALSSGLFGLLLLCVAAQSAYKSLKLRKSETKN